MKKKNLYLQIAEIVWSCEIFDRSELESAEAERMLQDGGAAEGGCRSTDA